MVVKSGRHRRAICIRRHKASASNGWTICGNFGVYRSLKPTLPIKPNVIHYIYCGSQISCVVVMSVVVVV